MPLELTLNAFEAQTTSSFQERAENISIDDLLHLLEGANYYISPVGKNLVAELKVGYHHPKSVYSVKIVEDELILRRGIDIFSLKDFRFKVIYDKKLSKLKNEKLALLAIEPDFPMG